MICGACKKSFKGKDGMDDAAPGITCSKCSTSYHTMCLNMSRDEHKLLRTKQNQYVCPSCKLKTKNSNSDNTPIRAKTLKSDVGPDHPMPVQPIPDLNMSTQTLEAFAKVVADLQHTFNTMNNEMSDFTKSLNATADDIASFRQELDSIKAQVKEFDKYKAEVIELRAEVADLRRGMAAQEQRRFLKDVEITGISENNSENLPQLVSVISSTLGVELDPRDVDDVRRVGVRGGTGALERPRPIVVTMTRRAPRDQLLRAARVRRGLTTDKLNLPGNSRRVYLNEHLTKENRVLFSKARKLGSDLHFKFVWTSNGNVFMRRTDTSSVLHVTSQATLDKLEAQSNPTISPHITQNCS